MRNREFVFTPKIEYELVAERSETNQNRLQFPTWCSILKIVRTHFAACGGEEFPPRKFGKAAKPHRSKPQKKPEKNIGSNHVLTERRKENFLINSMPKFESTPNLNNPELNPAEMGADINAGKKLEGELTPEELEKLKTEERPEQEQEAEKPELSPEEQVKNLEGELETRQQEITRLTESIEGTKAKLNEAREKLGLPPTEEEPPSVSSEKDRLEKLQAEQEALEKQKEELINQQEKERLVREEKEKILQEKLDELFKEFEALSPRDFESIFKSGRTREGGKVESPSMGELDPETAKSLARAFKKGIKLLSKILEVLPELLKKFDEDLTKEATERVEQKLEEEKQKMEEEQKKEEKPEEPQLEEKPEVPEGKVPPGEVKPEANPIEGGNVENPKA